MVSLTRLAFAGTLALGVTATSAMAGPIYTFSVSEGTQPTDVGTITLTQHDANSVDVDVDLRSGYGFVNTGGSHTPFAFNLSGSGALSISWTTPANGSYTYGVFSLDTGGGDNTPYGTFGVTIDSSAGNGSSNGYFGDLLFKLTRVGGLDTNDFVRNNDNDPILGGSYFSADLSNGTDTGAQAWALRTLCTANCVTQNDGSNPVPEPATLGLFAAGILGLGALRRRRPEKA